MDRRNFIEGTLAVAVTAAVGILAPFPAHKPEFEFDLRPGYATPNTEAAERVTVYWKGKKQGFCVACDRKSNTALKMLTRPNAQGQDIVVIHTLGDPDNPHFDHWTYTCRLNDGRIIPLGLIGPVRIEVT